MGQMQQVGSHKTTVSTEDGITRVVYHSTTVVKFDRDTVTLDSGGFETATTKARMNQAANQFGLEFHVWQKDFVWYVDMNGIPSRPFHDGMTFPRS